MAAVHYLDGQTKVSPDGRKIATYHAADNSWTVAPVANPLVPVSKQEANKAETYVAGLRTLKDSVETMENNARGIVALNKRTGSGGLLAAPGLGSLLTPVAEMFNTPLKAMEPLSHSIAVASKAKSDPMTAVEFMNLIGKVPGARVNPESNAEITQNYHRANVLASAKLSFADAYKTAHGGGISGLEPAWEAFKAKHFDTDTNFHQNGVPTAATEGWKIEPVQ